MGIRVGLDIGVASVGWAVILVDQENNTIKVLESCSNLFECADASKNVERRKARGAKRLTRRRQTRVSDFQRLWEESGYIIPDELCNNQLQLRVDGQQEELSLNEIYFCLLTMLKHRGISYLDDAELENAGGSAYQKGLSVNGSAIADGKLPCQIQLDKLLKYGKYRGYVEVEEENLTLSNVFPTSAYRREVVSFLERQSEYHPELSDAFIEEYLKIFDRKRPYYEGPGNELSRTDYGKYTTKLDSNGGFITEKNIFEKLIGKCSVRPEEFRAAGASYTAQEFNALNDLCNLKVNGEKLTEEQKRKVIDLYRSSTTAAVNVRKLIAKAIGEEIVTLEGARIDKSDKEIFSTMEQFRKMKKLFQEHNLSVENIGRDGLDEIGKILTLNTDKDSILDAFSDAEIYFFEDDVKDLAVKEDLILLRKKNGSMFSKWQSFGLSIMNDMIPVLYSEPKNQMQILTEMGAFKSRTEKFKECKYIPKELVTEEIYNPVVVRSVRIAVSIVNALLKKYGKLEEIVIEMPRDRNDEERKKRIKDIQKNNEDELNKIIKRVKDEYGITITEEDFHHQKNLVLRLKLWNEQGGICLYSGRTIEIRDLLNNPQMFEVDHIIPQSISFDDSRSNKVLVYQKENQDKGNQTPYMYLNGIGRAYDYNIFKAEVLSRKKMLGERKVNNLLNTADITKAEVLQGFINRNINDTRYASRVILNTFQEYFKAKEADTKVKVVRGAFTAQMRRKLRLKKNREESYAHHAVDAMIIGFATMCQEDYQVLVNEVVDFETGEIIDSSRWNEVFCDKTYEELMYANKLYSIMKCIEEAEKHVKYWHKVDTKPNRGLSNLTIYGTREYDGKKYKINSLNIYSSAPSNGYKTLVKMIEDGKQEKFLMYRNDPQTWQDLMKIYERYKDTKNAFAAYAKETGDYLRKYSKKHDGPKVTTLKYVDGEVNSCIDLSHKYGFEKGSRRVIMDSLNPYRMDVWYHEGQKRYYFVGIKHADLRADGELDKTAYTRNLISERVLEEGQTYDDLATLGFTFLDSFYKNDIIRYEKAGEFYTERFLSRTMPAKQNYIETKPIDAPNFTKQHLVGLKNTSYIQKIHVDILGNRYL